MTTSPQPPTPDHEIILTWGGLQISLTLARLFAGFWLTVFVGSGCFWILLTNASGLEAQAAIAILSSVTTAWITALTRNR